MKAKRQMKNIINNTKAVRKIENRKSKDSTVIVDALTNFEQACNENLASLDSNEDIGLLYMGRFGGVQHQFLCIDRNKFLKHLAQTEGYKISAKIRGKFHESIRATALTFLKNSIGHIEIYKTYNSPNEVTLFSRRESVRVNMPYDKGDHYYLERVTPVARKIFKEEIQKTENIKVSNFEFKTLPKFKNYINHDPLHNKKIDLVYTWVNGDDHEWKHRKNHYTKKISTSESHESASSNSRFKHIDELKYSIRSAFMYTNFINKIYIVTDQQVPPWLSENSQVVIIDHKEIFPDTSVLPTFNSHAIETCLHKISDLTNCFLYLNDDFLFGRSVTLDYFFTKNLYPKINHSNQSFIPDEEPSPYDLPVDSAAKNARNFFLEEYNFWVVRKFKHVACPVNKHYARTLEKEMKHHVEKTRAQRFRTYQDISFLTCAYYHYMTVLGKYAEGNLKYGYVDVNSNIELYRMKTNLVKPTTRRWDVFCLNDVDSESGELTKLFAKTVLEDIYPFKTPFET